MAKIIARNADLFAGGRDITGRSTTAALKMSAEAPDVTAFGEDDRNRMSNGIKDNELTVSGFYDPSASQIGETYDILLSSSTYYGFYYSGVSPSALGREIGGVLTDYGIDNSVQGAVAVSMTVSGSSPVYFSKVLESLSSASFTSASTVVPSSVDFSASNPNCIHVFRLIGLTRASSKECVSASFQDSANDSSWATLTEITTSSFPGDIQYYSGSGNRYRRLRYTVTGSTSGSVSGLTFLATSGNLP